MKSMTKDLRYYWARFDKLLIDDVLLGIRVPLKDGPTTQFRAIVPTHLDKRFYSSHKAQLQAATSVFKKNSW